MKIGRTALFIPASSPGMINSSFRMGADSLIFDLEDAVSLNEKDSARDLLESALHLNSNQTILVRINALDSEFWIKDFEMCLKNNVDALVVPKATVKDIKVISEKIDQEKAETVIIPLIETPISLEEISDIIKCSERVKAIFFGAEDYCLNFGIKRTKESNEILYARAKIANTANAFGIEALDTPFTDVDDLEGLEIDTVKAKDLGFTGKLVINPKHINIINNIFAPCQEEIDYAKRVIEAMKIAEKEGKGVFKLDGQMIDAPIVERAKNLINRSGSRGI